MKGNVFKPRRSVFLGCMIPGLIWYTVIVFVPIVLALYYGLFDWPGGKLKTFIALDNYKQIFTDVEFWSSFRNNIFLVIVCIIVQLGAAFVFTLLLNSRHVVLKGVHRTLSYFPAILSAVVIGYVWSMIYDYRYGILNTILKAVGKGDYAQAWLNNTKLVMILVAIPMIWQHIGYFMLIMLSAYAAIDTSILEMAEIDGATPFQRAVYVTFPMMKNTMLVCLTLCIAGNMKAYDHIYVMTNGGPGYASSVMALYAYKTSFLSYKMGYGSAISIMILILSLIIIGGSRALVMKCTKEED